jgi:hypothetical protein
MPSLGVRASRGGSGLARRILSTFYGWLPGLLLIVPATIPYVAHYAGSIGGVPTGFIQGDQAYYMANAREHFDSGNFSFLYGNPFDGSPDTPRIYWQPHIMLLGLLLRLTSLSPGIVYMFFGVCAALVCARVALALCRESPGMNGSTGVPVAILFFWGGGILVVAAIMQAVPGVLRGEGLMAGDLLRFDPGAGWWFLNFGRNLVFPTEAFYHALFFGCMLFLFRRRYVPAMLCAACLSASHPFSGIELLAILSVWTVVELAAGGEEKPPVGFVLSVFLVLLAHIGYYLIFLPSVPQQRDLMDQWEQPWILRPLSALFAYAPVALLAFWCLIKRGSPPFRDRNTRLLVVWCSVAFLLANHQYFLRAVQPLHFTRGYIWTPLFLLGAPLLQSSLRRLRGFRGTAIALCIMALFVSDNAVWLGIVGSGRMRADIVLTRDQQELLEWMNAWGDGATIVIARDVSLGYLATVYTPARAWVAHRFNTPKSAQREEEVKDFLDGGQERREWTGRRLLIVVPHGTKDRISPHANGAGDRAVAQRFTNASFDAVLVDPAPFPTPR